MCIDEIRLFYMQFCMDWRSIRFDWNRARAFLVTAEEGSLSAAARALGLTQPTLGRQIGALEAELDVLLFERVGRGLRLTAPGLELVEHARAMGAAASRLSLAASGQAQSLEGTVRITASEATAVFDLPPILSRLRETEPGITIEVVARNDLSDLRRREADIALRNARPTDPDLIARLLGESRAHLYAATSYLDRIGPLDGPGAMARAHFIGFEENEPFLDGLNALGLGLTPANFVALSACHPVHWAMVRAGLGIGVMTERDGDAEPGIRRAAPWLEPFRFPVWLVTHRELNTSRRIRRVFDFLADEVAAVLASEGTPAQPS